MKKVPCTPEMRNTVDCAVYRVVGACREDTHHLQFPAPSYRSKVEKEFRALDFNKVEVCRALHNAIHSTDHIPEKPSREVMAGEVWMDGVPLRAMTEREYQIMLGEKVLGLESPDVG